MFSLFTMILLCSLLPDLTLGLPPVSRPSFLWSTIDHVIAFGDSYTYVQGTPYGRQNYSFIGDLPNLAFTPEHLLESRIIQSQTSTANGGPNWIEYLTRCGVAQSSTNPGICEKQLWNFAFAGADITEALLPLHHEFTVPFVKQVEQFVNYGQPALKEIVRKEDTLVVIWIGINDVNDSKEMNVDFPAFYEELIKALFTALEKVRKLGYCKFLFMNLPPIDRAPGVITLFNMPNKSMVDCYDTALDKSVRSFREEKDVWVKIFDANAALNNVMDGHEVYGIRNITGYCAAYNQPDIDTDPEKYGCLPLDQYFWFNSGHMTSHVHQILAAELRQYLVNLSA
ncbi:carbohydrate esterase family 16 protein [Pseudocercospora fijiensis CIRAD86]|uniref:Carbohydrate esterase family 16 protein n=1 Tax=Pseudocercospora fijiensis (strain CIRAD86) TaxID=383855 RepID=M3AIR3_PSEFD|nr:carbohydrate esterase family 16 protein [Pseudocercospora fijiensis CIRAD86]EME84486.1 carbohydrate esterase family 16 protein [Pseudocercospora fijiensis CIRAD86]